jgi:hypothetical protein
MLTWKPAAPSSAVTCAIGPDGFCRRGRRALRLPVFPLDGGRIVDVPSSVLSLMTASLVMVTTGI